MLTTGNSAGNELYSSNLPLLAPLSSRSTIALDLKQAMPEQRELMIILSPDHSVSDLNRRCRVVQQISPRVVIIETTDLVWKEKMRETHGVEAVLDPGESPSVISVITSRMLTETEALFVNAYAQRSPHKQRVGDGLDWDSEGFSRLIRRKLPYRLFPFQRLREFAKPKPIVAHAGDLLVTKGGAVLHRGVTKKAEGERLVFVATYNPVATKPRRCGTGLQED